MSPCGCAQCTTAMQAPAAACIHALLAWQAATSEPRTHMHRCFVACALFAPARHMLRWLSSIPPEGTETKPSFSPQSAWAWPAECCSSLCVTFKLSVGLHPRLHSPMPMHAGIDYKTSTTVKSVDLKGKSLQTEGGDSIKYEKLIVATGSTVRGSWGWLIDTTQTAAAWYITAALDAFRQASLECLLLT